MELMDAELEQAKREAALLARRREELDTLKQQRKERAKTSVTASFSGKQKKQQLRARKQRLASRKDEEAALDRQSAQYEAFYADKPAPIEEEEGEDAEVDAFRVEPDFFARNNDLDNDLSSRLKLTVALGKNNKDAVGKELSSFFVKETKEQIQLRLMEGQRPLDLAKRETPLLATVSERDPILDHPTRPKWTYSMTKEKVDTNESLMFDQWLTKIHNKYDNEHLNHFEHNLEVWRELWRVTERATHVVVVADVRNPLLHIPASVYDLVTKELKKPMVVVLNKVDLIPTAAVQLWKRYLAGRFPLAQFVCFSSRSNAVHGDNDVSARRRVLSKKLEVGDASAIKGAVDILVACGIGAAEAQQLAEELNASLTDQESLQAEFDALQEKKKAVGKRRSRRKQKTRGPRNGNAGDDGMPRVHECQHCGCDDAVVACMSCATGGRPSSADANVKDEADAIARGYLLCVRCNREEHAELKGHFHVRLQSALAAESTDPSVPGSAGAIGQANTPKVTIGLIGHPNVGKSSVLNALAGKKIVSVSHTPGHTKRLQTIMISPEICICDCPGLVFPFAGVPKYLQELSGLYPYSQIREPYSAVRFLADHVVMEKILDLKPRTQLFDGLEEELEWTPWTLCEAYAEKRGYRTDRRGRPDHQRAGSELVRDTVDGILPLFFLPPDYAGKDITPTSIAKYCEQEDASLENEESDADEEEGDSSDIEEEKSTAQSIRRKKQQSAPINAFSLLDSDSSDEDSDDE
ncbi:Guanine nucleotide-binding-like protein 1 [Phytophthora pseudosyringae]|uniref:Guanine nucleotide-binding-like protein 1 n=1 Tax=Phytophthora pseudosyringae TaxID=221518 RepID=A0A8T1WLC2_9STRA|nr:Guanine nucleotide-binding-like protein 1 [Phytophthora pseudosyringae]